MSSRLLRALYGRPAYYLAPDADTGSAAGEDDAGNGQHADPTAGMGGAQGAPANGDGRADADQQGADDPQERRLTRENQSLRQRLRAMEAELEKHRAAQQTDLERALARAEKAEKASADIAGRIQRLELERAIDGLRQRHGIVASAATCARLIDPSKITWGDDHVPDREAVSEALKALAKSDPALVRQGPGDAGAGRSGGPQGGTDMNALIRGAAGR